MTHKTIEETLKYMGLPTLMINYIKDVYDRSATHISCCSWISDKIKPTCGVKQRDPMSPIIFNMVIERLLKELPDDIGARIGGLVINAAAFADDMLLFASTPMSLQKLLDLSVDFLDKCGLQVNASKCLTVSLRNVPREKKTVIGTETVFLCQGRVFPALKRTSKWSYLAVPFTRRKGQAGYNKQASRHVDKIDKDATETTAKAVCIAQIAPMSFLGYTTNLSLGAQTSVCCVNVIE